MENFGQNGNFGVNIQTLNFPENKKAQVFPTLFFL